MISSNQKHWALKVVRWIPVTGLPLASVTDTTDCVTGLPLASKHLNINMPSFKGYLYTNIISIYKS